MRVQVIQTMYMKPATLFAYPLPPFRADITVTVTVGHCFSGITSDFGMNNAFWCKTSAIHTSLGGIGEAHITACLTCCIPIERYGRVSYRRVQLGEGHLCKPAKSLLHHR